MCGRFKMLDCDQLQLVIECLEQGLPLARDLDRLEDMPMAYPGSIVPVITPQGGHLGLQDLRWGFEADWRKGRVFNTRIETAIGPNPGMWERPMAQGRCIVATPAFFEPHREKTQRGPSGRQVKAQYLFESPDATPLLLAAVEADGCFSIVTTAPNASVAPIHDRMPLVLTQRELPLWFGPNYAMLADRSAITLTAQPEEPDALAPEQGSLF